MAIVHGYTLTQADGTATSVVRPSDWNSGHNHVVTVSGNTAGASTVSGTNIVYQAGNNLTVSGVQGAGVATLIFNAPQQSTIVGSNNITISTTGSSIIISGANTVANTLAFSANGGSSSFSTLNFASQAGAGIQFSNSGGSVVIQHSLAGTGTTFAGTNVSATVNVGTNGVALSLSAPAGGGGAGVTMSAWEPNAIGPASYSSLGQNTLYFVPMKPMNNVTGTVINANITAATASSSISHAVNRTISYALYALQTGASSSQMSLVQSSSLAIQGSFSSNLSGGYTFAQGANSSTYSSAGTLIATSLSGQKIHGMPFALSLAAGSEYYFAIAHSTASTGNTGALSIQHQMVMLNSSTAASTWGRMGVNGVSISASSYIPNFMGFVYSATSAAFPATIALSQRAPTPGNARLYINIDS